MQLPLICILYLQCSVLHW